MGWDSCAQDADLGSVVMPGLAPGIHRQDVDGRNICANARARRAPRFCPAMTADIMGRFAGIRVDRNNFQA
jgi:hypothetical protein